jgi:hypothetical protein
MNKIQDLIEDYGKIALVIYLVLWASVLLVTLAAISLGYTGEKVSGVWAMIVATWVMAKVTQIPRIAATVALTPLVAAKIRKPKS